MKPDKIETRHFINNEWIDQGSGETYTVRNPTTGEVVAEFYEAGEKEVDLAVSAARKAFKSGPWSTFTGAQRAKCMLKFADLLEAKLETQPDTIAALDTMSMGVPIMIARHAFIPPCIEAFRYYAGYADKITGESFREHSSFYSLVQYEPFGVCAGIAAWNATLVFLGWKIAPALAAGNTFIFKSSEKNPFSTLVVAGLFKEAGFPDGVVNFVSGGATTGALLASHMGIDKISFTGSGATGRRIQEAATKSNMKDVTLELGGKSPAIVFNDAQMDVALEGCGNNFLFISGQACLAASRVFVQSSIAEAFVAGLKERFKSVPMDQDPSQETTILGPLVDKSQFDRVMSYVESGKSEAELVVGGQCGSGIGLFVQPTVFLNPKKDGRVYREEIFGPVLTVSTFETEEEALELANDTTYGLSAAVYTSDMARALRVAGKIEAGTVAINAAFYPDISVPFGGYKQSGQGRESGRAGLDAYLQAKTIRININTPSK